jgi:hypothetical protein
MTAAADVVDVAVVVELDAVEVVAVDRADAAVVVEAKLVLEEAGTNRRPTPKTKDVFTTKITATKTKTQRT